MSRRRYIDWARGIAVLIMVEAHALDAWTRAGDRSTMAFRNLTLIGGFAAPLFLWLAGIAAMLSAEKTMSRGSSRSAAAETMCRRGLEIFILAFLFRLQAFIVTPGSGPIALFKVDILNVMGPAIVGAGVVWGLCSRRAVAGTVLAIIATGIAMVTPLLRTAQWVALLPTWIQWYVRPAGEHTTFTMFPWSGFVFGGAAVGVLLAGAGREARLQAALGGAGAVLTAAGFFAASLPPIYANASFWTTSPTYFAVRTGIMLAGLVTLYCLAKVVPETWFGSLARLGRSSLFVYWVHVELVYGYATWVIHRRLHLWQTELAFVVLAMFLYECVILRDRVVELWRDRRPPQPLAAGPAATSV